MANSVLVRDDSNVKNLYRRALAYHMTSKLDEAERDFIKVAQLDPTMDEECKKQLKACK